MPKTHLKKFYQEQEGQEQNNKLQEKTQNSFSAGKNLLLQIKCARHAFMIVAVLCRKNKQ